MTTEIITYIAATIVIVAFAASTGNSQRKKLKANIEELKIDQTRYC